MEFTKLAVYDNENQTWSAWYPIQVGFEGNFVYDKTTDSAKCSILTDEKPNFKINQWAFIAHFTSDTDTILTYDENGLPTNAEQYIIAKFEKTKRKNGKFITTLALEEPIECFRGITTETLSFTNQTSKTVTESSVDVTYIKNKYNCLTALQRVLKITPANNDLEKSLFGKITILDSNYLENIEFDNETFSASDLFTILFKFDDIIDRTPVIYFDMENLGETKRYLLKFERKDGFEKDEINYDTFIENSISLSESDDIGTFATGVVSEVNNLTSTETITFPNTNLWAIPQYDTSDRDVPVGDSYKGSFYIETPLKIKKINKIKRLYIEGHHNDIAPNGEKYYIKRESSVIDNKYILEKQNYLASNLLDGGTEQDKCFWFEEGTNKVYVNEYWLKKDSPLGTFYALDPNFVILYYVEYEPLIDVAEQYGDNNYVVSINQSDGQIDSYKYSKFLNNYLKGMNKSDIILVKKYYNFNDFKNLIGSIVIKENENYIISNVSYKNANQLYVVAFQLNKANQRRNLNVKASEQIRANKAINYNNLKDRRSRFIDFIKINTESENSNSEFLPNKLVALSALIPNQISANLCPQIALFRAKGILTKNDTTTINYSNEYLLNIAKIINDKQIQFSLKTPDNAQIGTQKTPYDFYYYDPGNVIWYSIIAGADKQIPILYTDPFGEVQKCDVIFSKIDAEEFVDINDNNNEIEYNRTYAMYHIMANLPVIPTAYRTSIINNTIFAINNINKYKDMLESENDNFIFNVTSDNKNIIVCRKMLELSRLIKLNDSHDVGVMVYTHKIAENDILGTGFVPTIETYDSEKITLTFNTDFLPEETIKSIVVFAVETAGITPMLIINNPNETDIRNGFINIYY